MPCSSARATDPLIGARPRGVVPLYADVLLDVFGKDSMFGGAPFNVARNLPAFGL